MPEQTSTIRDSWSIWKGGCFRTTVRSFWLIQWFSPILQNSPSSIVNLWVSRSNAASVLNDCLVCNISHKCDPGQKITNVATTDMESPDDMVDRCGSISMTLVDLSMAFIPPKPFASSDQPSGRVLEPRSPTKPPFRVTSADVVIIWPDIWIIKAQHERSKSTAPGLNNESILYLNCVTPPIVSRAGTPVVSHKSHSCTPWKKNPRLSLATKKHYLGSCRCSKLSNKINTGQTLSVKASKLYPKEFPSRPPTRVENESLIQYVFFFQFHLFLYHFQNCKMQHPRWSKGSCLSCHPVVLPVPQGAKVLETAMDRSMLLALHLGMGPTIERTQTKVYPLKTNMTMENHHFC